RSGRQGKRPGMSQPGAARPRTTNWTSHNDALTAVPILIPRNTSLPLQRLWRIFAGLCSLDALHYATHHG
ncbi:hypothetical protein, partial [Paracoccus sp. (in: a-proteobacteria)]|uniref:hypothetical protein n=1 Tax=Paracoccus sp. TaxID=267 RepID=UPI00396CF8D9